jgi:hypothetical protein
MKNEDASGKKIRRKLLEYNRTLTTIVQRTMIGKKQDIS